MRDLPHFGDRVKVWPAVGVRVQDGAEKFGHFLAPTGREVTWDIYWHRRFLEGSIHMHDPAPGSSAKPAASQAAPAAENPAPAKAKE